jgi:hypothetical protein
VYEKLSEDLFFKLPGLNRKCDALENLFFVDFQILKGLKTKTGYYLESPQALFFQDSGEKLLKPIAIALSVENETLYTPLDNKEAWIFAKQAVLAAEILIMPLNAHLVESHLWMDPIIVATDKKLPMVHPIRELLYAHFEGTIAINKLAYHLLLKPKAFFDQISVYPFEEINKIVKKSLNEFKMENKILPKNFLNRNIFNISYYPYRDDLLLIWEAISNYVEAYLKFYYKKNDDLVNDEFVLGWRNMIEVEIGLDKSISLGDLLSSIIFNVFEHNLQQNSLLDENLDPRTGKLKLDKVPNHKDEITEEFLFNCVGGLKYIVSKGLLMWLISDQTNIINAGN